MIVAQQSTEACCAPNTAAINVCWAFWLDQDVADALVRPLGMVMGNELIHGPT